MFNPVAPYRYLFHTVYLFMVDITNADVFVCSCRTWICCLDITRFYEEQLVCMAGLPKKTVNQAPSAGGGRFRHNLHSSL